MHSIIRIEYPRDGKGLWRSNFDYPGDRILWKFSFCQNMIDRHETMNTPYEDLDLAAFFNTKYYSAFKSMAQMKQWIEDVWIREMLDFGFRVYLLEVSDLIEGKDQVIYLKENITRITDVSILFINN